jgi:hypothetical protein
VILDSRNARVGVFLLAGIAFFIYWMVVRPTTEASATQSEWPYVLWFSGTILMLALAVPTYGRMVGGTWNVRLASVTGAAAVWSSVVNVIEDGFGKDWGFLLFAIGAGVTVLSLLALAISLAVRGHRHRRALSLIPLGSAIAVLAFVDVGGPLMLVTWFAAAVIAARWKPALIGTPMGSGTAAEASHRESA